MILEAAKRAATSASPIPYMNKILSDWKQAEVFRVENIPDSDKAKNGAIPSKGAVTYLSPNVEAANAKADREHHYALLREKAQTVADRFLAQANGNKRFKELTAELSKMEIALAKAEVFDPKTLPALEAQKKGFLAERKAILADMGIEESSLTPQYQCKKCSDSGFLKSGAACDCYKIR